MAPVGWPGASLMAQMLKKLPTMHETWVQSLGQEDLLEREMMAHSIENSCLENSMDRGAWQATVHWVAESQTRLSGFHFTLLSWSSAQVVFTTWWWHICLIPFTWSDHLLFSTWSDFVHSLGKNTKVSFKATCSYHRHSSLSSHIFTMCDCAHMPYWTVSFLEVRTVSS